MMRSQGLNVAIFDVYHEMPEDMQDGIPILHWRSKHQAPDDSWMLHKHTKWKTIINSVCQQSRIDRFFREVVLFISDKANAFYCGSYHNGIATELFNLQKPCYYWGLRSDRLRFSWKKMTRSPINGLRILKERRMFFRNPFQRLFVSNPIIMEEYERLGLPRNRMVLREERVVEKITCNNLDALDKSISFLVIGQLRKEKHVPKTIQAFKKADLPGAKLKLIGRAREEYEAEIIEAIGTDSRIQRLNAFLDYEDFFRFFSQSHFVLFADEEGPSCITNGTMMEALIHHRPIICPNYNPFAYYVNKYGIGILYDANSVDSYASVLKKARDLGTDFFQDNINMFLETLMFDVVAKQFVIELKKQIQ
jgi:glycosyltransferase involved in cell wall biosynthesis